jgi:hypothetical protein
MYWSGIRVPHSQGHIPGLLEERQGWLSCGPGFEPGLIHDRMEHTTMRVQSA